MRLSGWLLVLWFVSSRSLAQDAAPTEPQPAAEQRTPSTSETSPVPPPPAHGSSGALHVPEAYRDASPVYALPPAPDARLRAPSLLRLPSRIEARVRTLDRDLAALSLQGAPLTEGIAGIVTGGVTITLAAVFGNNATDPFSIYMYVFGSMAVARGFVDLLVSPNAADIAETYGRMPRGTRDEVREALKEGERALERIAVRRRAVRYVEASLGVGAGLAIIPIYATQPNFEASTLDIIIIAGAGLSAVMGVIAFFNESDAERRWRAYRDLVEQQREERQRERGVTVGATIVPLPNGAALSMSGAF